MIGKPQTFFEVVHTSSEQYHYIKSNIDQYYSKKEKIKKDQFGNVRYDGEGKPKKRIIHPSFGKLKEIQSLTNSRILSQVPFPDVLHGAIKQKSCITNARAHQGNKYFFLTDLKSFFPSIHFNIVYDELVNLGFSPSVASIITRLVTYQKSVPQGAPTSSTIANIVFMPWDKELQKICKKYNLIYTRYVDDLAFSCKQYIDQKVIDEILGVIKKSPFQFHPRKTTTSTGVTEITGVLAKNNTLDAPQRKYDKLEELEPESEEAKGLEGHIRSILKA